MGLFCIGPTSDDLASRSCFHLQEPRVLDTERPRGVPPGLANLGNTCFANAVLQCMLNAPSLINEGHRLHRRCKDSSPSAKVTLGQCFQTLAQEYSSCSGSALQESSLALQNMSSAISAIIPQREANQQQDAYEFLGCLLEGLEEGLGGTSGACKPNGPKFDGIHAICGITTGTRRYCHACKETFEVDIVTDTALRLPLLSPGAELDASVRAQEEETTVTLQELLDATQRPESIQGYDCDVCRKRSAELGVEHTRSTITQHATTISVTRDLLIVVLNRFDHRLDADGNSESTKVRREVACPMELSLKTGKYNLFAVVSHLGENLSAGHYVASVRSRQDDLWYECNDEKVTILRLAELYDGRQALTSIRPGGEPYIVFYTRSPHFMDISEFCEGNVQVS